MSRSHIWKHSAEDFNRIVCESTTWKELLAVLGLTYCGGTLETVRKRIGQENIDPSHLWQGAAKKHRERLLHGGYSNSKPLEEVAVANSNYGRHLLKSRLLKLHLLDNKCGICTLPPVWNGAPLTLVLDHINGVSNDHRIENLRLICPNCNAQTPTFAGRNIQKKPPKTCLGCGKQVCRGALRCKSCAQTERQAKHKLTSQ